MVLPENIILFDGAAPLIINHFVTEYKSIKFIDAINKK